MATTFTIETDFSSIPLDKFEAYLNHPELNQMLEEGLGFSARKLISKEEIDGDTIWCFLVTKGGDLPQPLKKILKEDSFSWHEKSRFSPRDHCIYWEIVPINKMLKFSGRGVWKLSKNKKGCRRVIEGKIDVQIPIIGKMVENLIVKELTQTYEIEPAIQLRFFAER